MSGTCFFLKSNRRMFLVSFCQMRISEGERVCWFSVVDAKHVAEQKDANQSILWYMSYNGRAQPAITRTLVFFLFDKWFPQEYFVLQVVPQLVVGVIFFLRPYLGWSQWHKFYPSKTVIRILKWPPIPENKKIGLTPQIVSRYIMIHHDTSWYIKHHPHMDHEMVLSCLIHIIKIHQISISYIYLPMIYPYWFCIHIYHDLAIFVHTPKYPFGQPT